MGAISDIEAARIHQELMDAVKLHQDGELTEAENLYRKILERVPVHPDALHLLGQIVFKRGDEQQAVTLIRRAISVSPESPTYHNSLAEVLRVIAQTDQAIDACKAALRLNPALAEAHTTMGLALQDQARFEEAIASYEKALVINPKLTAAQHNLAFAEQKITQNVDAIERYRKVAESRPDNPSAWRNLAVAYSQVGRFDEAISIYRQALTIDPDYVEAYVGLGLVRKYTLDDEDDIRAMERLGSSDRPSAEQRRMLYFILGKVYDDCGIYDQAFAYYKKGNELKREMMAFDRAAYLLDHSRVRSNFSKEFFDSRRGAGHDSVLPIFIVGMPRSGTTLVEQIISSHPEVYGADELPYIEKIAQKLPSLAGTPRPYPRCMSRLINDHINAAAEEYLGYLNEFPGKFSRLTDKMPGNYVHIGLIATLFNNARIIHCRRNALDICLSIYFQDFQEGHDYAYSLADIGFVYRHYEELMNHWRNVLENRMLEIVYEELVSDTERISRDMIGYCELDWNQSCLKYNKTQRAVHTVSMWQARQPIYHSSINRWKNYEQYLEPLQEALAK